MHPPGINDVVMAAVCLHNLLITESPAAYAPAGMVDREVGAQRVGKAGQWRYDNQPASLEPQPAGRPTEKADDLRCQLIHWCRSPHGSVRWQDALLKVPPARWGLP